MHFLRHFKDHQPRCGTVTVGLDQRTITMGLNDLAIPSQAGGKRIDLILMGERAHDWRTTVYETLCARRTAILESVEDLQDADWKRADAVSADIDVEGFWKKRWWKDRSGAWQHSLELHVARFTFNGVQKGRLPQKD